MLYIYELLIEIFIGLTIGILFSITEIASMSIFLLITNLFKIGDYKTNLGTVLFVYLFPITIGSVYEFYKAKKINFQLGFILLFSLIIGNIIGSKIVLNKENPLSDKTIKYTTSAIGFFIGISFLISAYYEKNN
jgi:uncharacterized membrane protein YfcA